MLGIRLREITWFQSKERVVLSFGMNPKILLGISYVLLAVSFKQKWRERDWLTSWIPNTVLFPFLWVIPLQEASVKRSFNSLMSPIEQDFSLRSLLRTTGNCKQPCRRRGLFTYLRCRSGWVEAEPLRTGWRKLEHKARILYLGRRGPIHCWRPSASVSVQQSPAGFTP